MPKVPHPLKKKLSGSQAVSKCLQYDTPPATPERMRKYRKKHNQKPGMKVIHHGLIDQKLPPSSHIYGIKLSEVNTAFCPAQVTPKLVTKLVKCKTTEDSQPNQSQNS